MFCNKHTDHLKTSSTVYKHVHVRTCTYMNIPQHDGKFKVQVIHFILHSFQSRNTLQLYGFNDRPVNKNANTKVHSNSVDPRKSHHNFLFTGSISNFQHHVHVRT